VGVEVGLGVAVLVIEGVEEDNKWDVLFPWGKKVISRIPATNPIKAAAVIRLNWLFQKFCVNLISGFSSDIRTFLLVFRTASASGGKSFSLFRWTSLPIPLDSCRRLPAARYPPLGMIGSDP